MTQLIPGLADILVDEIDRPYAFYGHSLGARIAFEVAREFRRREAPVPIHMFVAACQAPQVPWPHPPVNGLDSSLFLREMQERYGAIPRQVVEDKELLGLLLPTLRADVTMIETYVYAPGAPLDCGITVFGGLEDHTVPQSTLEQWQAQTRGEFSLCMIPGNHFFPQLVESRLPERIASQLVNIAGSPKLDFQHRPLGGM